MFSTLEWFLGSDVNLGLSLESQRTHSYSEQRPEGRARELTAGELKKIKLYTVA